MRHNGLVTQSGGVDDRSDLHGADAVLQPALVDELSGRGGMFAALRVPTYRLLFWSGAASLFAVQVQFVTRGWLANDLVDSNAGLGAVYMAFGVPMLLSTPFGGVVADRFSKRNVLIAVQIAFVLSALWIGVGAQFGFVEYWMLLITSAVQGIGFAFLAPARMAMTSEVVGKGLLMNAIVLGQVSMNATRVIGPALAGVGIGVVWFGVAGVYYVATIMSAVALAMMIPLPRGRSDTPRKQMAPWRDFAEGILYVRGNRRVGLLILLSFGIVMLAFPYTAFLPRIATDLFGVGAAGYGLLSATSAVGAVIVSLFVARLSTESSAWRTQTVTAFAFGGGVVLLAVAPSFLLAVLACGLAGGAAAGFQAVNNSLILTLSDVEFHGRMQSLTMLSFSGFGMAALPLGILADAIGLRVALSLMGMVAIVLLGIYSLTRPRQARAFGSRAREQYRTAIPLDPPR